MISIRVGASACKSFYISLGLSVDGCIKVKIQSLTAPPCIVRSSYFAAGTVQKIIFLILDTKTLSIDYLLYKMKF